MTTLDLFASSLHHLVLYIPRIESVTTRHTRFVPQVLRMQSRRVEDLEAGLAGRMKHASAAIIADLIWGSWTSQKRQSRRALPGSWSSSEGYGNSSCRLDTYAFSCKACGNLTRRVNLLSPSARAPGQHHRKCSRCPSAGPGKD